MTSSYRDAGVDQDGADALIPRLAKQAVRTRRLENIDELGGFAGLVSLEDLTERGIKRPALAMATDGVGTKVDLLRKAGLHRVAGWDCVAMCVDDVVCCGAEPLMFTDYIAIERFEPDVVEQIVTGVADGCVEADCSLVGGETAQHPGLLVTGGYDVAGACVGIVDLDRVWGPAKVREGDELVGIASNGVHANGFSLVRQVLGDDDPPQGLLAPTAIYARKLLSLSDEVSVHAAAHVTGGGIADNLVRVLPDGLGTQIDVSCWERPGIFTWLASHGISEDEMRATFNLGVGMIVVTPDGKQAVEVLDRLGVSSWVMGEVSSGRSGVELV